MSDKSSNNCSVQKWKNNYPNNYDIMYYSDWEKLKNLCRWIRIGMGFDD